MEEYYAPTLSETVAGTQSRKRYRGSFFRTRSFDKGTVLGLSTVYGIVNKRGERVWVYGEPGAGTTFKDYLPQVDPNVDPADMRSALPAPTGRSKMARLLEDDVVRSLVCKVLVSHGSTSWESEMATTLSASPQRTISRSPGS